VRSTAIEILQKLLIRQRKRPLPDERCQRQRASHFGASAALLRHSPETHRFSL
jgi:hypothetical protein